MCALAAGTWSTRSMSTTMKNKTDRAGKGTSSAVASKGLSAGGRAVTSLRSRRISPISARGVRINAVYRVVKELWWKIQLALSAPDVPRCQVPGCNYPASPNPSHRHGRIGWLKCEYRLFDRLCAHHWNWPELNPEAARACGLLCEKGKFNTNPHDTRKQYRMV